MRQISHRTLFLSEVMSLVLFIVFSYSDGNAQDSRPSVKLELVSGTVFPGETASVRITISAPTDTSISVIKSERVYKRGVLDINLMRSDGWISNGLPKYMPTKSPDDFYELEAGKTTSMEFSVLAQAPKAGKYTVRVSFTIDPKGELTYKEDLPLLCQDIPEKAVKDKFSMEAYRGSSPETLELMNVKTEEGHKLIYRRMVASDASWCVRLLSLDEQSKIAAVYKGQISKDSAQCEIWMSVNKGKDMIFLRLEDVTGQILEQSIIQPKEK